MTPRAIEVAYIKELARLWGKVQDLVTTGISPFFDAIIPPGAPPMPRPREMTATTIGRQFDWLTIAVEQLLEDEDLPVVLGPYGDRVDRFVFNDLRRVVPIKPTKNPELIDQWITENVALIESGIIGPSDGVRLKPLLGDVEEVVKAAHESGVSQDVLRKMIRERFNVSNSRARLIARDQILKLNGQITQDKQQKAGITSYRWVTSRDERVRPSHARLDKTVHRWDTPPDVGHPGQDYQCRCTATPIIEI